MEKVGFLFPGQGAQVVGMGKDYYESQPTAQAMFEKANQVLGFDLKRICFEGPQEELNKTNICQPALFITSACGIEILKEEGRLSNIEPSACAGLSLGEYTALYFAESLSFEDGINLVYKRGSFMQGACDENPGTMFSIIGLSFEKVGETVTQIKEFGVATIANLNSPGQIVISGEKNALQEASKICLEMGAKRAIELQVAGAFHSPLMKPAQDRLASFIDETNFKKPRVPFVSNVTAGYLEEPSEIKDALKKQVTNPVLWQRSMELIINDGTNKFYEIGSGTVLKGLMRRINSEIEVINF